MQLRKINYDSYISINGNNSGISLPGHSRNPLDIWTSWCGCCQRRKKERLHAGLRCLWEKQTFDTPCALKDIDYGFNPSLDRSRIEELGKLHFLDAHENIITIVPPGVGKSRSPRGSVGMPVRQAERSCL